MTKLRLLPITVILAASIATAQPTESTSASAGLDEKVRDQPRLITTSRGKVWVHEGISGTRYYVAPTFEFLLLPHETTDTICSVNEVAVGGMRTVKLLMNVVSPELNDEVASRLSKLVNHEVSQADVGDLRLDALIVDLKDAAVKSQYVIIEQRLDNPRVRSSMYVHFLIVKEYVWLKLFDDLMLGDTTHKKYLIDFNFPIPECSYDALVSWAISRSY